MTPSEWPLRLVPRRSPPIWRAVAISLASIAAAIVSRGLFLGFPNAAGLSASYFPAFIVATLYAGPRWGWGTLAVALVLGLLNPGNIAGGASRDGIILLYALSGAITIFVASALREALLRLDESQAGEAKAQAELAASELRFRTLADSAPVLMWVSAADGRRVFVNQAYADYLAAPFAEALTFDWRQRLHPDDQERILAEQAAGVASQGPFTLEGRYLRHDSAWRWIRSVSRPRFLPDGEFAGYIGVGHDITDAKQAENDLKRINDLLAERVNGALAERDVAEAQLRRAQKLEAVGQLTGGVAHDFNNLLTVIIGALDLMQRHPEDETRRGRMVEAALSAARRGERLTQQLLAFARRQALRPELVRIDDLLAESEPLLRRAVGEAVSLNVTPAAGGAVANIDPSQFEAAVMNLVVNARDATPGGGSIRVESYRCTLADGQADEAPPGDYICVAVQDTGEGMDAETAQRVFEPFFTTKGPGRGTGLGLSQVYGFARQSGGGATVDSEPGKGASVRIYLPLAPDSLVEALPPADLPAAQPRWPSRRILLVEDDETVGDVIAAMLDELGHLTLRAADAAEALAIVTQGHPLDLMLTDVVMPGGKNGVELAREVTVLRPMLPVILSSGYAAESLGPVSEAPWPLLRKPYDADALGRALEAAIHSQTAGAA